MGHVVDINTLCTDICRDQDAAFIRAELFHQSQRATFVRLFVLAIVGGHGLAHVGMSLELEKPPQEASMK